MTIERLMSAIEAEMLRQGELDEHAFVTSIANGSMDRDCMQLYGEFNVRDLATAILANSLGDFGA